MSSAVEQIKSRLDILEVVGSYVKLEKAGVNYKGRCPFHNEKTPSFFVSPARQSYHCFGCSKGGDLISFVQEIEGLEFLEALDQLATRAGVELKPVNQGERSERERLFALLEAATVYYERTLLNNDPVKKYLEERGVNQEMVKRFRIGFAPAGWRNLYDHLVGAGFTEADLEKVGLIIKNSSGAGVRGTSYYDRFRERIIFPLANSTGKTVGFSGRIFGAAASLSDQAKYINSPQTALYDKSEILYGYDKAKVEIKRQDRCILVEGQVDLVMAHQTGSENTVAVSGTALTEKHLSLIGRLTNNLVMAFDSDLAGIAAARRALELALSMGFEVRIAELPVGQDPADVIVREPELWHNAVTQAKQIIDFYLSVLLKRGYDARALKLAVRNEVLPYIARLSNAMDQAHFVGQIAGALGVGEEPIWQEVKKLSTRSTPSAKAPTEQSDKKPASRKQTVSRRVVSLLWWQESLPEPQIDFDQANRELETLVGGARWQKIKEYFSPEKDKLILEAEIAYAGTEKLRTYLAELRDNLHEIFLKEELQLSFQELKQAELVKDYDKINVLLKRCQNLSNQINSSKSQ